MAARLRVRAVAEQRGMTLTSLSRKANVNMETVRRCWYNPRHDVLLSTLQKLADALEVRVTDLIDETPEQEEQSGKPTSNRTP